MDQNQALLGGAYNTGIQGLATTRQNRAWAQSRVEEFVRYFDTGYVDVPDVPGSPDSANIINLSIITFIVTVAINFIV